MKKLQVLAAVLVSVCVISMSVTSMVIGLRPAPVVPDYSSKIDELTGKLNDLLGREPVPPVPPSVAPNTPDYSDKLDELIGINKPEYRKVQSMRHYTISSVYNGNYSVSSSQTYVNIEMLDETEIPFEEFDETREVSQHLRWIGSTIPDVDMSGHNMPRYITWVENFNPEEPPFMPFVFGNAVESNTTVYYRVGYKPAEPDESDVTYYKATLYYWIGWIEIRIDGSQIYMRTYDIENTFTTVYFLASYFNVDIIDKVYLNAPTKPLPDKFGFL